MPTTAITNNEYKTYWITTAPYSNHCKNFILFNLLTFYEFMLPYFYVFVKNNGIILHKNMNPHGLSRGFATIMLKGDANVALFSKAVGHNSLEVTYTWKRSDRWG